MKYNDSITHKEKFKQKSKVLHYNYKNSLFYKIFISSIFSVIARFCNVITEIILKFSYHVQFLNMANFEI